MHRTLSASLAGMLLAAVPAAAGGIPAGRPQDDSRRVTVTDLDGRSVQPLARLDSTARGAVFVFTRSDCPIANRYAPELERLRRRAAAASVEFWLVFVDPGESVEAIRAHLTAYGYTGRALHDPRHDLVRATGATIAPEAAAFVRDLAAPRLVYRGRIDDRYRDAGRMRPAATTHDLEAVIDDLGEARVPALRETQAVGCVIADLR
jgi:hypothetical protein